MRPETGSEPRFAPPYQLPTWPFRAPAELTEGRRTRHPIVIVGGGLSGLTLACDLASRGVASVLIDEDDTIGVRGASSRGICYAQKSLEIFDRLGIYERIRDKGVTWSVGRTFSGTEEVYRFDLKTNSASEQPPFINLQQFYLEWFLVDRILALGHTDLRWKSRVVRVDSRDDHAIVEIETPLGVYTLEADYLIDATGANSPIRQQLNLAAMTSLGTDRWCITDVRFIKPLPTERWTWTDAPFNEARGVWQHLMADDVWRIDYQMDEQADPKLVSRPEVAAARLREQLGPDVNFEFVWIGPYQYRDHLLDEFRHQRIFFIGDAAHVVSPFGARGGNTGIQDANNLGWKLALVTRGEAAASLLDSYHAERRPAAEENLKVTSRSARFLAPRSTGEHRMRRAVIALARQFEFARSLINTGRMSVANSYPASRWLPDGGTSVQNVAFNGTTVMRALRDVSRGLGFWFGEPDAGIEQLLRERGIPLVTEEPASALARHLGAHEQSLVLVRPDAYVVATLHRATRFAVNAALESMA